MKFCSECGDKVSFEIPDGDNRPRYVCQSCGTIHYSNPRIITGTLPIAPDGRVLLCKRNIEPRRNYWTLPAGFMENDESTLEGALRETFEESKVSCTEGELLSVISLPQFNQVHLFYKTHMPDFTYSTTPESIEVRLFSENEIPWSQIAFKTVAKTLTYYYEGGHEVLNDVIRV